MKADFTLPHGAFVQHFLFGGKTPDLRSIAGGLFAKVNLVLARLSNVFGSISTEEAYLAKSQNIAELERRILELQSPRHGFSSWY